MKKIILALTLAAVMVMSGCGINAPDISASAPAASGNAETTKPPAPSDTVTTVSAVKFEIPNETKVLARPEELAPIKPLFESYFEGNEILIFAVSAVFSGEPYIIGFLYENNGRTLPFSRVIGFKQNGEYAEKAFVSDNYKPDANFEPENFLGFQDGMFYDTEVFETGGMLVVKTNEFASEDAAFHNFFLLSEQGLLDYHTNSNVIEPCEMFEYNGKLLLNESYAWYEFTVADNKIVLNEITDYTPYLPEINEEDFVLRLKRYHPKSYNENTGELSDDNYIEINVDDIRRIKKEDFKFEEGDSESGPVYMYNSKKSYEIETGANIIILYPPYTEICYGVSIDTGEELYYSSLPGAVVVKAEKAGKYTAYFENYEEIYLITITTK